MNRVGPGGRALLLTKGCDKLAIRKFRVVRLVLASVGLFLNFLFNDQILLFLMCSERRVQVLVAADILKC